MVRSAMARTLYALYARRESASTGRGARRQDRVMSATDADSDGRGRMSFGVNLGRLATPGPPGEDPAEGPMEVARWAEGAGFDVVTTADHVGSTSPFVMLTAAAVATSRVRLRTYV